MTEDTAILILFAAVVALMIVDHVIDRAICRKVARRARLNRGIPESERRFKSCMTARK